MYYINNIFTFYTEIQQLKKGEMPVPRMAIVYPSAKCNQNCGYCFYKDYNNGQILSYEKHILMLKELRNLGVNSIEWCGLGEPLFMEKPVEVFTEAKRMGFYLGLLTNGTMFRDLVMEKFIEVGNYVRISLDTVNRELYQKIRNSDALPLVLNNISNAIAYRSKVNSHCQISIKVGVSEEINMTEIQNVYDYFKNIDITSIQVKHVWDMSGEHLNKNINKGNIKELNEHGMKKVIKKLFPKSQKMTEQCWLNPIQITVGIDGNCYLCCYYMGRDKSHCFGNLFERPLKDIWYSKEHQAAIKNIRIRECDRHDCRFKNYINVANYELKHGNWHFI